MGDPQGHYDDSLQSQDEDVDDILLDDVPPGFIAGYQVVVEDPAAQRHDKHGDSQEEGVRKVVEEERHHGEAHQVTVGVVDLHLLYVDPAPVEHGRTCTRKIIYQ